MALPKPYAELLAEFGDHPRAALLVAAKYGTEAEYLQLHEMDGGGRAYGWNVAMNNPAWNGGGAETVDPIPDH
jgi:hypothetical protein